MNTSIPECAEKEQIRLLRRQVTALETQLRRNEAGLLKLHQACRELAGQTVDEVAQKVVQVAIDQLGFDRAMILLADPQQRFLLGSWGIDAKGVLKPTPDLVLSLDPGKSSWPEATRVGLGQLPYYLTQDLDGERPRSCEGDVKASLTVPLRAGSRIVGLLVTDNYFTGQPIPQERVSQLLTLAGQAAAALVNAQTGGELEAAYRKLFEEMMARQLEESFQLIALGQMAVGVAHELNQPLTAISVLAEGVQWLQRHGVEISAEESLDWSQEVLGQAARISALLNNLRQCAHERRETRKIMALDEIVRNAIEMCRAQLHAHDIALRLELAEAVPRLAGDQYRLVQIVLNLAANAREALDERAARQQALHQPVDEKILYIRTYITQKSGREIILEVEDNGSGFSQAERCRLFEPLFTSTGPRRAIGLGLSVAQAIVRDHGGVINCESKPGAGALFRVELPAAMHQQEAESTAGNAVGRPLDAANGKSIRHPASVG